MSMAEDAGIDAWLCEFCDKRVARTSDYILGKDGMRAHRKCVETYKVRERAADRRDIRESAQKPMHTVPLRDRGGL